MKNPSQSDPFTDHYHRYKNRLRQKVYCLALKEKMTLEECGQIPDSLSHYQALLEGRPSDEFCAQCQSVAWVCQPSLRLKNFLERWLNIEKQEIKQLPSLRRDLKRKRDLAAINVKQKDPGALDQYRGFNIHLILQGKQESLQLFLVMAHFLIWREMGAQGKAVHDKVISRWLAEFLKEQGVGQRKGGHYSPHRITEIIDFSLGKTAEASKKIQIGDNEWADFYDEKFFRAAEAFYELSDTKIDPAPEVEGVKYFTLPDCGRVVHSKYMAVSDVEPDELDKFLNGLTIAKNKRLNRKKRGRPKKSS